jgi:hypothetical protein
MVPQPVTIFTTVTGILNLIRGTIRSLYEDSVEWRNCTAWNETRMDKLNVLNDAIAQPCKANREV